LGVVVGSIAGVAAVAVQSVVEFGLVVPGYSLMAATLLGILAGSFRHVRAAGEPGMGLAGRIVCCVATLGCLVVLVPVVAKGTREGVALVEAGRAGMASSEGLKWLEAAVRAEASNPETRYLLGEGLRMRGFEGLEGSEAIVAKAVMQFEEAIRLSPLDPYPWARLAMCQDWLGRHGEAGETMTKALALDPENKSIVTLMGWHLMQVGKLDEAYVQLDRAHNKMPHERDPLSGVLLDQLAGMASSPFRQLRKGNAP
jgi:hypothetical protein